MKRGLNKRHVGRKYTLRDFAQRQRIARRFTNPTTSQLHPPRQPFHPNTYFHKLPNIPLPWPKLHLGKFSRPCACAPTDVYVHHPRTRLVIELGATQSSPDIVPCGILLGTFPPFSTLFWRKDNKLLMQFLPFLGTRGDQSDGARTFEPERIHTFSP